MYIKRLLRFQVAEDGFLQVSPNVSLTSVRFIGISLGRVSLTDFSLIGISHRREFYRSGVG